MRHPSCRMQRAICQREFELAYDSGESNLGTNPAITELYVLQSLKESETPELDYGKDKQLFTFLDAAGENALF